MHLLLNKSVLISLIVFISLLLVFTFIFSLYTQLNAYAYSSSFDTVENWSQENFDIFMNDVDQYLSNTGKLYMKYSSFYNCIFIGDEAEYTATRYKYDYNDGSKGDTSNNSFLEESLVIDLNNNIFDAPHRILQSSEYIDYIQLDYNETIKVQNNSSLVELKNDIKIEVGTGSNTGFIELYQQDDMMNPYKIIMIDNYDLTTGTITINVKNQDDLIDPIYIKNKTTNILYYNDYVNDNFQFLDKLPSTYYINVNNVTMLDYTNYEEDSYLMTYNTETGTGAPTLQWASVDLYDLVEFGEKVDVASFKLEPGKKYYLKWINPDEYSNISVVRYSTPISPQTPDDPVLDSTFDDYFSLSNPDGSSEEESIEKTYIDMNEIQDKVIYQNKSTYDINVQLSILDNYDGDIYTEIQQLYADTENIFYWQKVKSALFNDYNNSNITIKPNQRIIIGLVDGLAKFTYPVEKYVGYEVVELEQGTDYEISIYENAISNNKDDAYSTISTNGSITYDDDFNLDEWNLGDDGLPDIPNDFNDKLIPSVPVIELPSMDLNSEDGALATIKSSMEIVKSMVSIMFDNPLTSIFLTAFGITIPIAIFKFIRG